MKYIQYNDFKFPLKNFDKIYSEKDNDFHLARYKKLLKKFINYYKINSSDFEKITFFSSPGRTELCGNHTDHNSGRVLCGSIQNDIIAATIKTDDNIITLKSDNYHIIKINLDKIHKYKLPSKTSSLIAGVVSYLKENNFNTGGFTAFLTSNIASGSGLSSSAAFEVLIFTILNYYYNNNKIDLITGAKAAQYAENEFFKKPCGLMDQLGCIYGGLISIDFKNSLPEIDKIDFSFEKNGYKLCIVNVGKSHCGLTEDYASVRNEMSEISNHFNKEVLRDINIDMLFNEIPNLRENDRAVLRAIHYITENERVENLFNSFKNNDIEKILEIIKKSGNSSFMYLQNIFSEKNYKEQSASLGLCIAQTILDQNGAWRIHGGGFGGTIQCIVPLKKLNCFFKTMEKIFGKKSVIKIQIRNTGACKI